MSKLTEALNTILNYAKSDPKALVEAGEDQDLLSKATTALQGATGLDGAPVVEDRWVAGQVHAAPTKEEIKTGPTQLASGEGAERMVRDYSNPAKQHGVTEVADKFERILHIVSASAKAQTDAIQLLIKSQENMTAVLAKSTLAKADHEDEAEEEDEEDEEESEVVEINASKAKAKAAKLFRKAQKTLKQIKAHGDDEAMEEDEDVKKALSGAIAVMRKSVAKTLRCASQNAAVAGDVATIKAVTKAAKKADINVVQEEEEEEEEEDEEEETKSRAAKAKVDKKGNQSDSMDAATGNQSDEAAKSLAEALAVAKKSEQVVAEALAGVNTLATDVKGLMGIISGMSRADFKTAPAVVKAETSELEQAVDYDKQIAKARAGGQLSEAGALTARGILEKSKLVKAGFFDASQLENMIKTASPEVRAIYAGFKIEGKAA